LVQWAKDIPEDYRIQQFLQNNKFGDGQAILRAEFSAFLHALVGGAIELVFMKSIFFTN
jgi:hypothetical protein